MKPVSKVSLFQLSENSFSFVICCRQPQTLCEASSRGPPIESFLSPTALNDYKPHLTAQWRMMWRVEENCNLVKFYANSNAHTERGIVFTWAHTLGSNGFSRWFLPEPHKNSRKWLIGRHEWSFNIEWFEDFQNRRAIMVKHGKHIWVKLIKVEVNKF